VRAPAVEYNRGRPRPVEAARTVIAKLRDDEMAETGERESKRAPGSFTRRLLREVKQLGLPSAGEPVVVAVSGGADSTALVLALVKLLRAKLLAVNVKVAHLDHGLRGSAGAEDARHVERLAGELGLEVDIGRAAVSSRVSATRDNLEQAARRERYEFLARAARGAGASVVLTGHTLDDQAETFLLALLRGSGAGGLGAMRPARLLDDALPAVSLVRPLLSWARRDEVEAYCRERGVSWRADAMNEDELYTRVRVRRQLLPLLETFNPRIRESLARAAELLRADSVALDEAAASLLEEAADAAAPGEVDAECDRGGRSVAPLRIESLAAAAEAVRRRALRLWLAAGRGSARRLELRHIESVERLLAGSRGGRVAELPGGCSVIRRRRWLFFRAAQK
jgi:tRNA(Ile)-lysidine synthase